MSALKKPLSDCKVLWSNAFRRLPIKKEKAPPVRREALDTQQLASLFQTLVELGRAWAAVMGLCQLFLGERADCVRQLRTSWPQEARTPAVCIPERVNKKTTSREVPLHSGLAWLPCFITGCFVNHSGARSSHGHIQGKKFRKGTDCCSQGLI